MLILLLLLSADLKINGGIFLVDIEYIAPVTYSRTDRSVLVRPVPEIFVTHISEHLPELKMFWTLIAAGSDLLRRERRAHFP